MRTIIEGLFFSIFMQTLALNACTTLVSLEPRLTMETRDRILEVHLWDIWIAILLTVVLSTIFGKELQLMCLFVCGMQATLSFFALPSGPSDVIDPLVDSLITLLCAILLTRYSFM